MNSLTLLDELHALDTHLRRAVALFRAGSAQPQSDEWRGLYISDPEVDTLLDRAPGTNDLPILPLPEQPPFERLAHLMTRLGLNDFERRVIVIALAAEIDLKYERLFAYLQDDVTKKRPTVDLVLRLIYPSVEERLDARRAFDPDAPLLHWELITLHDDPGARHPVLPARYIKLEERIVTFLLGDDTPDARLRPYLAATTQGAVELAADTLQLIESWADQWRSEWQMRAPVIEFQGAYGVGKRAAAHWLAQRLGRPLLMLNAGTLGVDKQLDIETAFRLAEREARLSGAVLAWYAPDALLQPHGDEADHRAFLNGLARGDAFALLLNQRAWEPAHELGARSFLRLELSVPGFAERQAAWHAQLDKSSPPFEHGDIYLLAARYRLTVAQIQNAVARARSLAWTRSPQEPHMTLADLESAARTQSQHSLNALARQIRPRYTWEDIVLPEDQREILREIILTVQGAPQVLEEWGVGTKLAASAGVTILFAGPPGTGKTMAAEIIAVQLGLDLYKIDLSTIVSKYIGETEKNLERIFTEAANSNAILFFDEADSIFGKRSEVRDSHDRYANIEVSYLLQRMEAYDGVTVLATNLRANLDEAFTRRLQFAVDFPFPDEADRLRIWQTLFPPNLPRAELDLPLLARRYRLAGGSIRNIIVSAAYLAAADGGQVTMEHLLHGTRRELQKMGRLFGEQS